MCKQRNQTGKPMSLMLWNTRWAWAVPCLSLMLIAAAGACLAQPADPVPEPATIYSTAKSALEQGQVTKSQQLGFALTKTPFDECPPDGAVLVGFDAGVGKFVDKEHVYSLRPLYRTADKGEVYFGDQGLFPDAQADPKKPGKAKATRIVQEKAKPGYAVGAITLRTGLHVHGMYLTYMRVKGSGLDPQAAYNSNWIGDGKSGTEKTLHGNGSPIVGVFGNKNDQQVLAVGLYFANVPAVQAPPPPQVKTDPPSVNPERVQKTPAQTDTLRQGRTDELQGDTSTPPIDIAQRLKPVSATTPAGTTTEEDAQAAAAEEDDGFGDFFLIGLFVLVIVAVPAAALFLVFGRGKKKDRGAKPGKRGQDTEPLAMILSRGAAPLPGMAASISARPFGAAPSTDMPHLPGNARSAETPAGLPRHAATPPDNARLPNMRVHGSDSIMPDLPAVGVLSTAASRNIGASVPGMPPIPDAAKQPANKPQWGFSVAGSGSGQQPAYFSARATCSLGKNRSYRVYVLPTELLFIEAGFGDANQAMATGAMVGGLVGGLIGGLMANSAKKKAETLQRQLEMASTDELMQMAAQWKNCFRTPVAELTAAQLDAAGFWHRMTYGGSKCAALLRCKFARQGDYTLELQELKDVEMAIEKLTQILGGTLEVNVIWDGRSKFVKKPKQPALV